MGLYTLGTGCAGLRAGDTNCNSEDTQGRAIDKQTVANWKHLTLTQTIGAELIEQ